MSDENVLPGIDVPDGITKDATEFLARSNANPGRAADNHNELVGWLAERMTRVSKENRDHHYKTIAEAYAVYAAMRQTSSLRLAIVSAAKAQGIAISGRKTILRILIELHISYTTDTDPKSVKQAGNNYSRDVKAIEGLIRRGIPPSEVLELSKKLKEGLDYWARSSQPAPNKKGGFAAGLGASDNQDKPLLPSDVPPPSATIKRKAGKNGTVNYDRWHRNFDTVPGIITWEKITNRGRIVYKVVNTDGKFDEELRSLLKKYSADS